MCQVHLVKVLNRKTLNNQELQAFDSLMEDGSYSNKDAWGVFTKRGLHKQAGEYYNVSYEEKTNVLDGLTGKNINFIVGHNRLTTQGDGRNNENNHPFETKDLVMVHNGVLHNDEELSYSKGLSYKGETDSLVAIHAIQELLNKGLKIIKAIKIVAEKLSGSFSIIVYHKKSDKLYYFKNDKTRFSFALVKHKNGRKTLLGSTDANNFKSVFLTYEHCFAVKTYSRIYVQDADPEVIYEISDDDMKEVGIFKASKQVVSYGWGDYSGWQDNTRRVQVGDKDFITLEKGRKEVKDFIKVIYDYEMPTAILWSEQKIRFYFSEGQREEITAMFEGYGDYGLGNSWDMSQEEVSAFYKEIMKPTPDNKEEVEEEE